ncbi:anthranilate synthase component II [Spirosoma sordidisoli]|uniref:Aminodeoxychorismate/anthranilate synthase component II n=1 Tax=Spirosoma sordidisoli TaxID=2502893 RepID=A0A4Q2UW96_9BACT|nr:aminodeoxychorismate/anthranilate synthase component II [Spirosoma sordidisoli]RYC71239.1 aminodeoxychorismate/anthranilate synthase component II [Spirosoma sordidisoli]
MKLLLLDNYDSFTFTLVDYLRQAGADCRVVRNDEPFERLVAQPVDGVVLSPGPGRPKQAGRLLDIIDYYHRRVPMLGVCLGHQAIGEWAGASLGPALQPMHGKVSRVRVGTHPDPLLTGLPDSFSVTRYHSLVLTQLPASLDCILETESGEVMGIRHRTLPLWGVQFHPEAVLTEWGLPLLTNWIKIVQKLTQNQYLPHR